MLRYGLGLFETMLLQDGQIMLANYHWERLYEGMKKLEFDLPAHFTSDYLQEEVIKTVNKNNLEKLCRVRLQLFTEMEGVFTREKKEPAFLVECFELEKPTMEWNVEGWICGMTNGIFKSNDTLANLKTCNMLLYSVAAQQAKAHNWNDALVLNHQGHIIESTIANIFWVKNGTVFTPPLNEGCIAGVMRRHLIERCSRLNFFIEEKPLTFELLEDADEVFLSNAIRRMKWVKGIHSFAYQTSVAQQLYQELFYDPFTKQK